MRDATTLADLLRTPAMERVLDRAREGGAMSDAKWTLHHGDCLDPLTGLASLPDRSIDVVLTDPPYSEHVHANGKLTPRGRAKVGDKLAGRDLRFACITQDQVEALADQYARLARRWVLVFSDEESTHLWRGALRSAGLRYARTGHWVKSNPQPQLTGDRPGAGTEAIVICHGVGSGRWRWNGGGRPALWTFPVASGPGRVNESQKPEALLSALVRDFTEPGETVLDSHAGSGTTGASCLMLGRRFVGWEARESQHAKASARLAGVREQGEMFAPKGPKPKQARIDWRDGR